MDLLSRSQLKALVDAPKSPCVSLYMPTVKMSEQTQQNPIRFRNLWGQIEDRLEEMGIRPAEAESWLQPMKALDTADFWEHQDRGLAIFASPNQFRYYRVPVEFEELVVIGDEFHLKPLMPLVTNNGRFYILALSKHQVRLLEATRDRVRDIDLEGIPTSIEEALKYDTPQEDLQQHTATPNVNAGGGDRPAMFHGQGVGTSDDKTEILRFFQQVDRGIYDRLGDDTAPLILAGVEYLHPIYKEANSYPHIFHEGLTGNPDLEKPEELRDRAWKIVEPYFQKSYHEAVQRYQETSANAPDRTFDRVEDIVPAAYYKRLDALFVPLEKHCWGQFDSQQNRVETHDEPQPDDTDLFDMAAVYTFINGGEVYTVNEEEVPNESQLAAIARY